MSIGARSGKDYMEGLRDGREVWLDGDRVRDVVADPRFKSSVEGIAGYYDHALEYADDCITTDPASGALVNVSHVIPRSREDLDRRHRAFDRLARYSMGMLGRTPDYVNLTRGDRARTGDGVGLGLAIVQAIAEAHGGTATIADTGPTVVQVRLPVDLSRS